MVLADQAVFSGGSFVLSLALAQLLSISDFGLFSALVLGSYLVMSIANAVVIQPFQVLVSTFSDQKDYPVFALLGHSILVFTILGLLLLISRLPFFQEYLPDSISAVSLTWLGGFLFQDFFRKAFLAMGKPWLTLITDVLAIGFQLCTIGYFLLHPGIALPVLLFWLGMAYIPSVLTGFLLFPKMEICSRNWSGYLRLHLSQGGWMLLTALLQWGSNNLFTVASGVYIGVEALGAFRLVQSLFGILNMIFQTFENHLLPEATRLFHSSAEQSKAYLKASFKQTSLPLLLALVFLFLFSKEVIVLAGGQKFEVYHYVVKGMSILYGIILIGYPVRLAIRMMTLNQIFFTGYLFSFAFSLLSFQFLLGQFQLWGALAGLLFNQLIMLIFWNHSLTKRQFILWK